ncbi:hypothetical protein DFH29DRAFT_996027 [Suillus ampliporus]|nr:hypothetical protein DFH29DRAFT_996027 [Suillus ampliporus]
MGRHRGKLVTSTDPDSCDKVARQTLNDWSKGLHMSCGDFTKSRQLLQPSEEEAVKDWLAHESGAARPVQPRDLSARVNEISGRLPGKHWHCRYLARHKKSISTHKPWNLDLKRAQNFNKTTVEGYFTLRGELDKKYNGIPAAHNWNMNEKGNQMGGGWNGDGSKFIFATEDRDFYRQHSDNLELVFAQR